MFIGSLNTANTNQFLTSAYYGNISIFSLLISIILSFIISVLLGKIYILDSNYPNKSNYKRVYIGERIRDIISINNTVFLFLENTASIGKIDL